MPSEIYYTLDDCDEQGNVTLCRVYAYEEYHDFSSDRDYVERTMEIYPPNELSKAFALLDGVQPVCRIRQDTPQWKEYKRKRLAVKGVKLKRQTD